MRQFLHFIFALCALLPVACVTSPSTPPHTGADLTSSPVTTDLAGASAMSSRLAVVRVRCASTHKAGTAFLHQSGRYITAAHVIEGCPQGGLQLINASGASTSASAFALDFDRDLGLLTPAENLAGIPLRLAAQGTTPTLGSLLSTWGFPDGYSGFPPLLCVGYFSGSELVRLDPGKSPRRQYVVNGAFNHGNSGGPILLIESGVVVGVVSNKLQPFPENIASVLKALKAQKSGFVYTRTFNDGHQEQVSEGQIIAEVLDFLRAQTQLVVGRAVTLSDLREFLQSHGLAP